MTDPEMDGGTTRDDLVRRVELIETMIAEGRHSMCRYGWIFVLWGLVNLAGWGWQYMRPHAGWVWPVCLGTGAVITGIGLAMQGRDQGRGTSMQCRSVGAVWSMMGVALALYVGSALMAHLAWQYSYIAGMLMIVGLAHAISAAILRWNVQGVVAAIWWAGGVAVFLFNSRRAVNDIFLLEMCFGMILFGVYAMILERRRGGWGGRHA
jgi:hypothetical protein